MYDTIPYYHREEFDVALWNINKAKAIDQIPTINELWSLFDTVGQFNEPTIKIALSDAIYNKINRLKDGNIY